MNLGIFAEVGVPAGNLIGALVGLVGILAVTGLKIWGELDQHRSNRQADDECRYRLRMLERWADHVCQTDPRFGPAPGTVPNPIHSRH